MALPFSDTTGLWLVYTTWLVLEPENGGGGAYLYTGMECVLRAPAYCQVNDGRRAHIS